MLTLIDQINGVEYDCEHKRVLEGYSGLVYGLESGELCFDENMRFINRNNLHLISPKTDTIQEMRRLNRKLINGAITQAQSEIDRLKNAENYNGGEVTLAIETARSALELANTVANNQDKFFEVWASDGVYSASDGALFFMFTGPTRSYIWALTTSFRTDSTFDLEYVPHTGTANPMF
jgi:hypothetical protein